MELNLKWNHLALKILFNNQTLFVIGCIPDVSIKGITFGANWGSTLVTSFQNISDVTFRIVKISWRPHGMIEFTQVSFDLTSQVSSFDTILMLEWTNPTHLKVDLLYANHQEKCNDKIKACLPQTQWVFNFLEVVTNACRRNKLLV